MMLPAKRDQRFGIVFVGDDDSQPFVFLERCSRMQSAELRCLQGHEMQGKMGVGRLGEWSLVWLADAHRLKRESDVETA